MTNTRAALIIASDKFGDAAFPDLQAPGTDAEALAAVLEDPLIGGFETRVLANQPRHVVIEAIEEFFSDRGPDDLLLLYFAGHGIKDPSGRLYLATTDTRLQRLVATGISSNDVNYLIDQSYSTRKVLLLDCCYSGAFARGLASRSGESVGVKEQFQGHGLAVITASDSFEYAFEDGRLSAESGEPSSVFTKAIVQGLATGKADLDEDGLISVQDLYGYVVDEVRRITPRQTPTMSSARVRGELYIAQNRHRLAELPVDLKQAIDSEVSWQREGAVSGLKDLLANVDVGLALAARAELERLAHDDSRRVSGAAIAALSQHDWTGAGEPATPQREPRVQPPPRASTEPAVAGAADRPEQVLSHKGGVRTIAFGPDGRTLATGGPDKSVRIWDLASGQEVHRLVQRSEILDIAFSPDGTQLAVANGGTEISVREVATGREPHNFSSMHGNAVAYSPDGSQLAYVVLNGARLVSAATGGKVRRFKARMSYAAKSWGFFCIAFNPDGSELAIGGVYGPLVGPEYGVARVWNTTSGEEMLTLAHDTPATVVDIAFDPTGKRLATAGSDSNVATIWTCDSGKVLRQFAHDDAVSTLAFSPDGASLATGCKDRFVRLWDTTSGRELRRFAHDWQVTDVAFSPDGRLLAAANGRNATWVWAIP